MAVSVKKIVLWRSEVSNQPGMLADILEPFAKTGTNLQVVMGYVFPGSARAAIEIYPVSGKKPSGAARAVGLKSSSIPTLLVEGDNRPGLGHSVAKAIAGAGINVDFLVAQVIGKKYSAVIGFASTAESRRAATLIRRATAAKKK